MNDDINYINSVEKIIDDIKNNTTLKIEKISITEEISTKEEINNSSNGTAYVTNSQNGMGNILSPQP